MNPNHTLWHHCGVLLAPARLATLRRRIAKKIEPTYTAWLALKATADANIAPKPHAPEHWYVPGFYVDKEGHRTAKEGLLLDANTAYALALCYRMTGEERYALAAARLINAWPATVATMSRENDSTLSFSYHFPAMIFAADLLADSPSWQTDERQSFLRFVREKALPLNTMERSNNWGNWGLVLVLACAAYLDDPELFAQGVARWKEFITEQIAEDGHLPHEVTRNEGSSGIWYSHFTLMPQTVAAEIARVNGVDLYDYLAPNGRTLRMAFDRLAPWAHAPATFPYWQGDPAQLHSTDYVSYFEILHAHWPSSPAGAMLHRLRPLTAIHSAPFLTFTHGNLLHDTEGDTL